MHMEPPMHRYFVSNLLIMNSVRHYMSAASFRTLLPMNDHFEVRDYPFVMRYSPTHTLSLDFSPTKGSGEIEHAHP